MATDRYQNTQDGQELQQSDVNLVAKEAALAEDLVLAELLRLEPYNGSAVAKTILPYRVAGSSGQGAMVQPNGATGSVLLLPFRAVVGSRTAPGSSGIVPNPTAIDNWRDIRSAIYAPTDDAATLGHAVAFAVNASGNPRWDLVYALVQPDQNATNVLRSVRAPGATVGVSTSLVATLQQKVTIGVVAGTPGASPAVPALPTDTVTATGNFYIAIAAVRIPNGFGASSVIATTDILMQSPHVPISTALGMSILKPANGFAQKLPASVTQTWGGTGTRPKEALPSTMIGGRSLFFLFDATGASPTIGDAATLDDSIDWRNRYFIVTVFAKSGATQFASQPGATSGAIPQAGNAQAQTIQWGQSIRDDSAAVLGVASRNAGVVYYANNALLPAIAAGPNAIGFYVDLATGALKVFYAGTPGPLLAFEIRATAPIDNV